MLEVDECTKRDMSPDFVKLVESFHGIATIRVTKNSQLSTAIRIMLDHPGAFFLELLINRTADVTPMVRPGGNLADFIEFRTNS
jgi:acetolactate synthase-1/2/3 large subunit